MLTFDLASSLELHSGALLGWRENKVTLLGVVPARHDAFGIP